MTTDVVMFSSGVGSAVTALRVREARVRAGEGLEDLVLLFADVGEDPDNYRFLREAASWIGGRLVVLDNGGRTIWDVFRKERYLGNTMKDPCSKVLKREPMRKWLEENCEPETTRVHLGFDISEEFRLDRARPYWTPWSIDAPLCWEPPIWKDQAIALLAAVGIEAPLLTRLGFPHANCGGGCIKAGQAQFERLLRERPAVFDHWEREEEGVRVFLGKDVAILRDRRRGEGETGPKAKTKPMTLAAFRERLGVDPYDFDPADEGACNCMGNWEA